jgi:hypothetical protein
MEVEWPSETMAVTYIPSCVKSQMTTMWKAKSICPLFIYSTIPNYDIYSAILEKTYAKQGWYYDFMLWKERIGEKAV